MTAFAYYRLPCEQHATYVAQHVGESEILSSVAQLNGKEGFVIAPFQPSAECPVVLILSACRSEVGVYCLAASASDLPVEAS